MEEDVGSPRERLQGSHRRAVFLGVPPSLPPYVKPSPGSLMWQCPLLLALEIPSLGCSENMVSWTRWLTGPHVVWDVTNSEPRGSGLGSVILLTRCVRDFRRE